MTFPATPIPVGAEMLIDGTWTDITSKVRGNGDSVTVTRGAQNEQGDSLTPCSCGFKLNNRDFYFSNRNPNSVNYGKLPINTQVRFWLDDANGYAFAPVNGFPYSYAFGESAAEYVSTTDKAVLDITGDLDVRVHLWPDAMPGGGLTGYMLASKYNTISNQRSWAFMLESDNTLRLYWSTSGTSATLLSATSTAAVDFAGGPLAVRATIDVNNGAAGKTVTFYTSDSVSGSWTILGSAVTTAGTTSIFSSTAPVQVGVVENSDGDVTVFASDVVPVRGRVYRMQLYSGIAGTLVADMNATAQTLGDTSWSDGLGTPNTWTVTATYGGVTAGRYRFWGEVAELPQKADSSGVDLYVPTVASDIVRRLTQGKSAIASAMHRYYSRFTTTTQWHTMESGVSTSTGVTGRLGSAIGSYDCRYRDISFGTDSGLPGSAGVATFNSTESYLTASTKTTANATYQGAMWAFQMSAVPGSETFFIELRSTGTVRKWHVRPSATSFVLRGYGADGSEVGNLASTFGTDVLPTDWLLMRLQTHVSGGNIIAELAWCKVASTIVWGFTSTTEFPGTTSGRFTGYSFGSATQAIAALNGLKVSQVITVQEQIPTGDYDFYNAPGGYDEEPAGKRAIRVANSTGVPLIISGDPEDTTPMGPEPQATSVAILEDCAKVDGGYLTTRRDAPVFHFVTRKSLLDQDPVVLDHDDKLFTDALDPTDDDATLRNKVVLTAPAGQTATSIVEDGPKGTEIAGVYESTYSLNGHKDVLAYLAQHATYLGTWDEIRLPQFSVMLARTAFSSDAALTGYIHGLDVGSVARVDNPPAWFPPGHSLEVMVRGYREVMSNMTHDFTVFCQNYGPFRATNNLSEQSDVPARAAASNSTLGTGIDDNDTSISIATPTGALWTTAAGDFPMDIEMGGEVITLSGISGASSPQTATASARSVNGIIKSHLAGTDIQVVDRFYAAL